MERRNEAETRQKLAAIVEGPFPDEIVNDLTVIILQPDETVERVSRDGVDIAPEAPTPSLSP